MSRLVKWAPGTRIRSRRRPARTGHVVGRVGTFLAVQWDGDSKPKRPYVCPVRTPRNSPLRQADFTYAERTWVVLSSYDVVQDHE